MKNCILSQVSANMYSDYSLGCNGPLCDLSSQMSSESITHDSSSSSFCYLNNMDFPYDHSGVHSVKYNESSGSTTMLPRQKLNHLIKEGEYPSTSIPVQDNKLQSHYTESRNEVQLKIQRVRKRSADQGPSDAIQTTRSPTPTTHCVINSKTNSKKRPMMSFQEQLPQIQREKVPAVKRSQKITDKITILQKLVSPYGKTDTASVLLEACISIQALQDQIRNLVHMLTDNSDMKMEGERPLDLRSKGLCLAPVSQAKNLAGDSPRYSLQPRINEQLLGS